MMSIVWLIYLQVHKNNCDVADENVQETRVMALKNINLEVDSQVAIA